MQIKPIHNCVRSRKRIYKRVNERPHSLTAFNNNARLFVPLEKIELSQHEYNIALEHENCCFKIRKTDEILAGLGKMDA